MKFPVKMRGKIKRKNSIGISVFCYENMEKHPIYVLKKHVDLLLIGEEGKSCSMFLLKILILSCMIILYIVKKKHFCRYCLQAFSTEEILKHHIKDCFKINGKQRIIMPKKG